MKTPISLLTLALSSVIGLAQSFPKLPDPKHPAPILKVPSESIVDIDEIEKKRFRIALQLQPLVLQDEQLARQQQEAVNATFVRVGLSQDKYVIDESTWTLVPKPEAPPVVPRVMPKGPEALRDQSTQGKKQQ